ncbi:MAG TPA: hypothetical protein VFH68_12660 [Polyangia bacterium]|jgi:hypothetical protein|nr:hypothetical protein [Polyangia bacterium]
MKIFTIVVGFAGAAIIAGALAVGCGPQKAYCPQTSTGQCVNQDTGIVQPPPEDASDGGAVILD